MNFTKKFTLAASAILLTSTLASAQTVLVDATATPITFSATIARTATLVVTDGKLAYDGTTNTNLVLTTAASTLTPALLQTAGSLAITSTYAAWDVTVTAKNGGKLAQETYVAGSGYQTEYLKAISNNSLIDATLRAYFCIANSQLTMATITNANNTDCGLTQQVIDGSRTLTTGAIISDYEAATAGTPLSLAGRTSIPSASFTKAANVSGASATPANAATIVIYAALPYTEAELDGNGTYAEEFTFALTSAY